jgi:MFS transporter, DHA1 family, inner membrane transport protein
MGHSRRVIAALTAANFVVGFSVLVVPGMLTSIAKGFMVSVPVVGLLITAGSIVMGLGAPLIAAFTSLVDRRHLLVGALLLFALGHAVCALVDQFLILVIARSITLVAAAIVTPQAAATIGLLVPVAQRGSAVAAIFVGWSIASVVAMPVANVLALHLNWRAPFLIASALSLLVALWVAAAVPKGLKTTPLSVASWISVARHPVLVPVLLVTMVSMAGQFVLFSFMVPALEQYLRLGSLVIPALLFFYGVLGVVGNTLAVRYLPKYGADLVVHLALSFVALALVFWAIAFWVGGNSVGVIALLVIGNLFWGLGGFSANSAQQGRLMAAAPQLASASIALNTSFLYLGQAIGTPAGAALIAHQGYSALPWLALALLLTAIALTRRAKAVTRI